MVVTASPDVKTLAASVGILVDRTADAAGSRLGNVWVIDDDKVATCAHLVFGYKSFLASLKVEFPELGKEFGVDNIMFHPRFNLKNAGQMAQVALTEPSPMLPLQAHNAAVLKLSVDLQPLSDDLTWKVNRSLSLPLPPRDQGLGGNLGEIDLYVVLQTITNSRKEGVLTICDARNYPVARIFCQGGRLMFAEYANLQNEMAIFQIVNKDLKGNFYFWAASQPNWDASKPIARPADMLLIESHRRFDELKKLVLLVGGPKALYLRGGAQPSLEVLPAEIKDYAAIIWDLLDGGTPVGKLWQLANLDDYAIYSTLFHLLQTKQIALLPDEPLTLSSNPRLMPLLPSVDSHLQPGDEITDIYRDFDSSKALIRKGLLLGAMREQDPWHLVHNIRLVPDSAGSPLLNKDGKVIGMHCGSLPADSAKSDSRGAMQGMLWVDSIIECLKGGGEKQLAERLTLIDTIPNEPIKKAAQDRGAQSKTIAGCRDLARVDCPRCGRTSLDSARFCKSCGQRLLKDINMPKPKKKAGSGAAMTSILVAASVALIGGVAYFAMNIPKPILIDEDAPSVSMTTEPSTDQSSSTVASNPDTTTNPDATTQNPDSTVTSPDSTSGPDSTSAQDATPQSPDSPPDATTNPPDATATPPDVTNPPDTQTTKPPDGTTKPDATTKAPDGTTIASATTGSTTSSAPGAKIAPETWMSLSVYKDFLRPTKKNPNAHKWEAQPQGATFKEGDLIHIKLQAHKKAFYYLLYKAKTGDASLIYPPQSVKNELAKGNAFTIPSKVVEVVNKKLNLNHHIGLTIADSPGTETFLVVASPRPLNLVYGDDKAPEVFLAANKPLQKAGISGSKNERGILVSPKDLPGKVTSGSGTTGSSTDGTDSIYISKWVIPHIK